MWKRIVLSSVKISLIRVSFHNAKYEVWASSTIYVHTSPASCRWQYHLIWILITGKMIWVNEGTSKKGTTGNKRKRVVWIVMGDVILCLAQKLETTPRNTKFPNEHACTAIIDSGLKQNPWEIPQTLSITIAWTCHKLFIHNCHLVDACDTIDFQCNIRFTPGYSQNYPLALLTSAAYTTSVMFENKWQHCLESRVRSWVL